MKTRVPKKDMLSNGDLQEEQKLTKKRKRTFSRGKSGIAMLVVFLLQMAIIFFLIIPWRGYALEIFIGGAPARITSSRDLVNQTQAVFPQYFTVRVWDTATNTELGIEPIYLLGFNGTYVSPEINSKLDQYFSRPFFDLALEKIKWPEQILRKTEEDIIRVESLRVYYAEQDLANCMKDFFEKYPGKTTLLPMEEIVENIKPFLDSGIMQEITIEVK